MKIFLFLIAKRYKVKHKILEALDTKTNGQKYDANIGDKWYFTIPELIDKANITEEDYRKYNSLLYDRKEIIQSFHNDMENIAIGQKGMTALNERRYLRQGVNSLHKDIYTVFGWVIPTLALAASIYSIIKSNSFNAEAAVLKQQQELQKVKIRLKQVEQQIKTPVSQPNVHPDSTYHF